MTQQEQIDAFLKFDPKTRYFLLCIGNASPAKKKRRGHLYLVDVKAMADDIVRATIETCHVSIEEVMSEMRNAAVIHARHIIFYLMCCNGYQLKAIGKLLNRDHSTVIYARDHHAKRLEDDSYYAELYQKVITRINSLKNAKTTIS